jgi:hypothetical protein
LAQYGDASSLINPEKQDLYSFGALLGSSVNFTIPMTKDAKQLVAVDDPNEVPFTDRLDNLVGRGLLL